MDKARLEMGSVPVRIAARVYGRDPAWVRAGIIAGWLPIGEATRNGKRVTDIQHMMRNDDSAADALDNAMKAGQANWELKLYESLKTDQAERYLKR